MIYIEENKDSDEKFKESLKKFVEALKKPNNFEKGFTIIEKLFETVDHNITPIYEKCKNLKKTLDKMELILDVRNGIINMFSKNKDFSFDGFI
ncbi:MAG: hypothetical protein V3V33_13580 [Candidatus Lokiarchaeia archaeon]